jgi:hypothetical protein
VVDLFSPHDGSIDLRVLSECFLETDFVENEVRACGEESVDMRSVHADLISSLRMRSVHAERRAPEFGGARVVVGGMCLHARTGETVGDRWGVVLVPQP